MHPLVRNIVAVVVGIVVGGLVNGSIIAVSGKVIPLPQGIDPNNAESLKNGIHLLKAQHFLMPFLAHAMGTFTGALLTAIIAANYKLRLALVVGIFYLLGGVAACFMIPAPIWFMVADLVLAYIPTALAAGKLGGGERLSN